MSEISKTLTIGPTKLILYYVNQNREIHIYDGMTFGRSEGNEQFPNDPLVSRIHFKILVQGQQVLIENLEPANKTLLNGKPILSKSKVSLRLGDQIQIGNQQFVFQNKGEPLRAIVPAIAPKFSREEVILGFQNFLKIKNWTFESYLIFGISLTGVYLNYSDLLDTACSFGPTPYPDLPLSSVAKSIFFGLFCTYFYQLNRARWAHNPTSINKRYANAWVWGFLAFICATSFDDSSKHQVPMNRASCGCMNPNIHKDTVLTCQQWASGKVIILGQDGPRLAKFDSLPIDTRNTIFANIARQMPSVVQEQEQAKRIPSSITPSPSPQGANSPNPAFSMTPIK